MRRALKALLMTVGLSGCSGLDVLDALSSSSGYTAETGLPFGPGARQKLDVYRPLEPVARPAPVVVFFYGGGWTAGDRHHYRFAGQAFASLGYVTVVPDYRLFPEARYPAFVEDGAAAVAWTQANIARHGGDPRRVFLVGHSAGAHTAVMLAVNHALLRAAGADPAGIAGAVGLAGPYDFEPSGRNREILDYDRLGRATMATDFADGSNPPLLLMTGADDTTVSPGNTERLATRVRERGGPVRVTTYPDMGHIKILTALASPLRWSAPVRQDIAGFLADPR